MDRHPIAETVWHYIEGKNIAHEVDNDLRGVNDYVHTEVEGRGRYSDTVCGEAVTWDRTDRHGDTATCFDCL